MVSLSPQIEKIGVCRALFGWRREVMSIWPEFTSYAFIIPVFAEGSSREQVPQLLWEQTGHLYIFASLKSINLNGTLSTPRVPSDPQYSYRFRSCLPKISIALT